MSPEGAAWVSEMWATVPEYSNADGQVSKPRPVRKVCPHCNVAYSPTNLARHKRMRHPEQL